MRRSALTKHASIIAIGFVTMSGNAWAQDAETAPAEEEYSTLDEIVVTASGRDQTKLESSISVTSVNAQMIQDFQPSSMLRALIRGLPEFA